MSPLGSWINWIISFLFPPKTTEGDVNVLEPEETKEEVTEETKEEETKEEETKEEAEEITEEEVEINIEEKEEEKKQEIFDNELPIEAKKVIFTQNNPKKALIIGINYDNDSFEGDDLNGCENDMNRLSEWIKDKCHFKDEEITKLDSKTATKENMLNELQRLVEFATVNPKSELWLSYSGHGSHYFSASESDYQDEILCPADYSTAGYISDNWLRKEFVNKLPYDCKLFVIMDCCHSGSNMDLPYYLEDGIVNTRSFESDINPAAKVIKMSGCLDVQVSMDYYNSQMREFQGAFTNSFVKSYTDDIVLTYLDNLNTYLKSNNFKQISELALSDPSLWAWKIC